MIATTITPEVAAPTAKSEMKALVGAHWPQLALTYLLFNVENLLRLAQPLLLGLAIDSLLRGGYLGLVWFAVGHTAHMTVRILRQMVDTRVFTRIYAERASELVLEQRGHGVAVSQVSARSALSREFVEFFELYVPLVVQSLYSLIGAIVMLCWFDWAVALFCLAISVPAYLLNRFYGKRSLSISRFLHDVMEREVDVIDEANEKTVAQHYGELSRWRVKQSDWEAFTVGLMEFFVLGLMAAALIRFCATPNVLAGEIFAVFRYVMMFVMAIDAVPRLVHQSSRLKDIGKRIGKKRKRAIGGRR